MEENAVGYLLDLLDDDAHREMGAYIDAHPEAKFQLDRLRHALEPLACDKDVYDPPMELVMRTVARVAEHVVSTEERVVDNSVSPVAEFVRSLSQPKQPSEPPIFPWHAGEASPPPSRRRDLIASVGLTTALLLIGATGILTLRQSQETQSCQNNLRAVHQDLSSYCDANNDRYPQVGAGEDVQLTLAKLQKACSTSANTLSCPGATHQVAGLPVIDYAYSLGYRDPRGELQGRNRQENENFPILADAPYRRDGESMPVNHRKGQNVLFGGGNVRFCTNPNVGPQDGGTGDDIYFNLDREARAGKHRFDSVLGCANDQP